MTHVPKYQIIKCQANKFPKHLRKYLMSKKKSKQNKSKYSRLRRAKISILRFLLNFDNFMLKYQSLGSCLILTTFCNLVVDD